MLLAKASKEVADLLKSEFDAAKDSARRFGDWKKLDSLIDAVVKDITDRAARDVEQQKAAKFLHEEAQCSHCGHDYHSHGGGYRECDYQAHGNADPCRCVGWNGE